MIITVNIQHYHIQRKHPNPDLKSNHSPTPLNFINCNIGALAGRTPQKINLILLEEDLRLLIHSSRLFFNFRKVLVVLLLVLGLVHHLLRLIRQIDFKLLRFEFSELTNFPYH